MKDLKYPEKPIDRPIGKPTDKQIKGAAAEAQALAYLQRQGLIFIERNYRCKGGELDLIMTHRDTLVFVEVRMRSGPYFDGAAASITSSKIKKLVIAAQMFLSRYPSIPSCRFDVIAIDGEKISWLQNAINADW